MTEPRVLTDTEMIEANRAQYKSELDKLVDEAISALSKTYGLAVSQAIIMYTAHRMIQSAIPVLPKSAVEDYKYVSAVTEHIAIGTFHNERQEGRI